MSVLEVSALNVRYGGVHAVRDLSFSIDSGQILALIGPNGAGKTSAIDGMSGYASSTGSVFLDGADVTGVSVHRRARAGMGRTFQQVELFANLTVRENLWVAAQASGRGDARSVEDAINTFGLSEYRDVAIDGLPQGVRRLTGLARAQASRPIAMLLDEPASGLDNSESEAMRGHLRELARSGIGILLVEHDMELVMGVSDMVLVIQFGEVIAHGDPASIQNDPRVAEAYLGVTSEVEDA